jgi:hypothetical protein
MIKVEVMKIDVANAKGEIPALESMLNSGWTIVACVCVKGELLYTLVQNA